jgi:hypothetical protein
MSVDKKRVVRNHGELSLHDILFVILKLNGNE